MEKKQIEMYHHQLKGERLKKDKNFNIDPWYGYFIFLFIIYNEDSFYLHNGYAYVILLVSLPFVLRT